MVRTAYRWGVLPVLLVSLSVFAGNRETIPNLGIVVENGIYRGAQPDVEALERLKGMGVRTVLKLNHHGLEAEKAACDRLGLRFIHLPTRPETIASAESCGTVSQALTVLRDRDNWPVYVHCSFGRDRTGYLVGLYRLRHQRWSWPEVDMELLRHGHGTKERAAYPEITRALEQGPPNCTP